MPVVVLAVVAVAATTYGAIEQKEAADNAAQVDTATANYNAKYDASLAKQLDLDTQQNIDNERQQATQYLSKQQASYASAGVESTTGSALHAQLTNAGRFEQKIQQDWVNSQQQQQQYYAQGKVGIAAGAAQAEADRLTGSIALINGVAKDASIAMSFAGGGSFGGGVGGGGGAPSGMGDIDGADLASGSTAAGGGN